MLSRLLARKGFRAHIKDRYTVVYRENGRKMNIAGEMLVDGFAISVCSIITWNDSKGELIDEAEQQRIARNVRESLESQGKRVELS